MTPTPTPLHGAPELLPCPFCGCAAGYVKHSAGMLGTQGFDKWDAVACKHCRATIGACDRRFRCREDARDAWNRRVAPPAPASREAAMVVVESNAAGTPTVWCDPEIVDLVTALNAGGLPTIASCSGHGETLGRITLKDGRELLITDYDTATTIQRSARAAIQQAAGAVPEGRSDKDYAIEHAEYMAKDGERLIDAVHDLARAESEHGDGQANESDVIAAGNTLSEALVSLRGGIYEFRKRRDRAASPSPLGRQSGSSDHSVPCAGGGVTQPLTEWVATAERLCQEWANSANLLDDGVTIQQYRAAKDAALEHLRSLIAPRPDAPTSQINPGSAPRED